MGNYQSINKKLDESQYRVLKEDPQFNFLKSQLVMYNKNQYIMCSQMHQGKDEYVKMIKLCHIYKDQTNSIFINLHDFFPMDQGFGCSKIYRLDMIFNVPKLSLQQLNSLYRKNQIYYEENEIWYIIKQALQFFQFYQDQQKNYNYGYVDAYKVFISHDGQCLYPNFIFLQQSESTQYFDSSFLQSLGIDLNDIMEDQLFMLTIVVMIFDTAILKIPDLSNNYTGLFDILQYSNGIKFLQKNYSKQLSSFVQSICQKNSQYDVKSYLDYIQKNNNILVAPQLDSNKFRKQLNQSLKPSFFQDKNQFISVQENQKNQQLIRNNLELQIEFTNNDKLAKSSQLQRTSRSPKKQIFSKHTSNQSFKNSKDTKIFKSRNSIMNYVQENDIDTDIKQQQIQFQKETKDIEIKQNIQNDHQQNNIEFMEKSQKEMPQEQQINQEQEIQQIHDSHYQEYKNFLESSFKKSQQLDEAKFGQNTIPSLNQKNLNENNKIKNIGLKQQAEQIESNNMQSTKIKSVSINSNPFQRQDLINQAEDNLNYEKYEKDLINNRNEYIQNEFIKQSLNQDSYLNDDKGNDIQKYQSQNLNSSKIKNDQNYFTFKDNETKKSYNQNILDNNCQFQQ